MSKCSNEKLEKETKRKNGGKNSMIKTMYMYNMLKRNAGES